MTHFFERLPVKQKLTFLLSLGTLLPLLGSLGAAAYFELRAIHREAETEITIAANMAAEFSAADLAFEDRESCKRTLDTLAKRTDIVAASVNTSVGTTFCAYERPGQKTPLPRGLELDSIPFRTPVKRNGFIDVRWPVTFGGNHFGALHLRASTEKLVERRNAFLFIVATGVLALGAILVAMTTLMGRVVSSPIQQLAAAATRITERGDYSVRVGVSQSDELGVLARAFNTMVAEVERRREALKQSELALRQSYGQLARTQKELVEKERLAAVGELAAVVAHEVRNPLGAIFNSLQALKHHVPQTGSVPQLLGILDEEADRLSRIVEDLLDFSRPTTPELKPVDLDAMIHGAVEVASRATSVTASPRVDVTINTEPGTRPLLDERMMRQVLINLVINAVQASNGVARIEIRAGVELRRGQLLTRIEVEDHGIGMDDATLAKVFQPFFSTKAKGTGLGLALVRRFVEAHGGEVSVKSKTGEGSTFTLRTPLAL